MREKVLRRENGRLCLAITIELPPFGRHRGSLHMIKLYKNTLDTDRPSHGSAGAKILIVPSEKSSTPDEG
jgi:hypothetical protein